MSDEAPTTDAVDPTAVELPEAPTTWSRGSAQVSVEPDAAPVIVDAAIVRPYLVGFRNAGRDLTVRMTAGQFMAVVTCREWTHRDDAVDAFRAWLEARA